MVHWKPGIISSLQGNKKTTEKLGHLSRTLKWVHNMQMGKPEFKLGSTWHQNSF